MALNQNINFGMPTKHDPSTPADTKQLLRARSAQPATPAVKPGDDQQMGAVLSNYGWTGPMVADAQTAHAKTAAAGPLATVPLVGRTMADNVASTTAPAPAAAAPVTRDNIGQANLAALDNLGSPLARGVTRYNMDPGNEAQVYTTRGKDGSIIFTDNAKYAAQNSAGGLRRSDVNANVLARTQGDRNGYEYAKSSLNQLGLTRDQISNLDPSRLQSAYTTASIGGQGNTEQALADRNDANLLRAHMQTAGMQPTFGAGAPDQAGTAPSASAGGGNTSLLRGLGAIDLDKLPPAQRIAAIRLQQQAEEKAQQLEIQRGQLDETRKGRETQEANSQRQATQATIDQYLKMKEQDPEGAATFLASKFPTDPAKLKNWLSGEGQFVADHYLKDVLQPGARNSLFGLELGDRSYTPQLTYGDLALKNGRFAGLRRPGDAPDKVQYPAEENGWGRFVDNKSLFSSFNNYDPSINSINPQVLQALQAYYSRPVDNETGN